MTKHEVHTIFTLGVTTLEGLEALQGNPGRAGDKLKKPGSALLVEGLHGFPKPLHNVAVWSAVFEPRVGLPVVDVDFAEATYNQLRVEDGGRFSMLN